MKCVEPPRGRGGLMVNLYSVRSAANLGIGDVGDLRALIDLAKERGLDFVGVNPLHAIRATRLECSPYSPISRSWRNPLYIDVEQVPEFATSAAARRILRERRPLLARLRRARRLDWDAVRRLKLAVLRALHAEFRRTANATATARGREYRAFVLEHGDSLLDFARFVAIDEQQRARGVRGWRRWPRALQDARSPEVEAFAARNAERIECERWMQFELDRQLAAAARHAQSRGLSIGLYFDLAVGSIDDSADVWASPSSYAEACSLGAPPDAFSRTGQLWHLTPWKPAAMLRGGCAPFRALLRRSMAHAGLLRIDHAIGLVRQYQFALDRFGRRKGAGRFVQFPADKLLRAIVEESRAAGCAVVAEDLGALPRGLRPRLRRHGLLSTRVLLFERTQDGFTRPRSYARDALLCAATHDLPPLRGWIDGTDLAIQRRLGVLRSDAKLRAARVRRRAEVAALDALLGEGRDGAAPAGADRVDAIHALLARSGSALYAVQLDDLLGERLPVNVPGATPDRHPCWSRRMHVALERKGS